MATITSYGSIPYASAASVTALPGATVIIDQAPEIWILVGSGANARMSGSPSNSLATVIGRAATLDVTNFREVTISESGAFAQVTGSSMILRVSDTGARAVATMTGGTGIVRGGGVITMAGSGGACTASRESRPFSPTLLC